MCWWRCPQAIFNVEPGVSFHSVQEVYTDKPRMAIQVRPHLGPALLRAARAEGSKAPKPK